MTHFISCHELTPLFPESHHCNHCGGPSYDADGNPEDEGCEDSGGSIEVAGVGTVYLTLCCSFDVGELLEATPEEARELLRPILDTGNTPTR